MDFLKYVILFITYKQSEVFAVVSYTVWFDKLPEDKAKYYNRTRMNIELFAYKMHIASQVIIEDLRRCGYRYNAAKRLFEPIAK